MAIIFRDSTALYNTSTLATTLKNYSSSVVNSYRQAGAWGAGSYSFEVSLESANSQQLSLPSASTYTTGFRFMADAGGTGPFTGTSGSTICVLGPVTLQWNASLQIQIWLTGPNVTEFTATAFAASVWHYVELQVFTHATAGTITLWIDGIQVYAGTGLNTNNSGNITSVLWGNANAPNSGAVHGWFTDIYVTDTTNADGANNTGFLGPIRIESKLSSADGSHSDFTPENVNRIPTLNMASIETDASAWTIVSGGTLTYSTAQAKFGSASLLMTASSTSFEFQSSAGTAGCPVLPNSAYSMNVWCYSSDASGITFNFFFKWYDSTGALISTSTSLISTTPSISFAWSQLQSSTTVTSPINAAYMAFDVTVTGAVATHTYYFDGWQLIEGTAGTNYPTYTNPVSTHYTATDEDAEDADLSYVVSSTVGAKDSYKLPSISSTLGTPLEVSVTNVARKDSTNPRSAAALLRYGSGPSSGVRYTDVSGTNTTDRIMNGTLYCFRQLSDGTDVWLETDGTNVYLMYSFDHQNTHQIASITTSNFIGLGLGYMAMALVVDTSDNIMIVGLDTATQKTISVQAYTKTANQYAWTAQTTVSSGTALSAATLRLCAEWCSTGGGTNSKGHIVVLTYGTSAHDAQVLDAGVAIAGTGTLLVNNYTAFASISAGSSGSGSGVNLLDMSQDGLGGTRGVVVTMASTFSSVLSGSVHTGQVAVGCWSVSSTGVLTSTLTAASLGSGATTGAEFGVATSHFGSNGSGLWNIYYWYSNGSWINIAAGGVNVSTLTGNIQTTISNFPSNFSLNPWGVYHNPTSNKDYIVAWQGTNTIVQEGVSSYGTGMFDSTATNIETVLSNTNTFGWLRCPKVCTQSAFIPIQFSANVSGTYSLYGDWTGSGTVPGDFTGTASTLNNDLGYHAFTGVWPLNPATGLPWTINQVNAIEAGTTITA